MRTLIQAQPPKAVPDVCGLVGLLSANRKNLNPEILVRMRDAIAHRGPDDLGLELMPAAGFGLGFARLSIIDPTLAGHQPMWNADRSVVIVFNGEIYNFRALREELTSLGFHFRSMTDTEVVLHGYEQWGEGVLGRLTGMFALGIVDLRDHRADPRPRVLLARDRMGEKPLYYWWDQSSTTFLFASEIKALLVHPAVGRSVCPHALECYLGIGYVPAPHTMFDGISKLPAGHMLDLRMEGPPRVSPYWQIPPPTSGPLTRREQIIQVRELVEQAVASRLMSDVPLAAFLSGGVDSTIIVGLMSRLMKEPVQTFSAAFEIGPRSVKYNVDAESAELVSKQFGTSHTRLTLDFQNDFGKIVKEVICQADEPHANPTLVSTYLLAQEVKSRGISVVLTGDGSDELFGGYPRYQRDRWVGMLARILPFMRGKIRDWSPSRLKQALEKADLPELSADRYLTWWTMFSPGERRSLLTDPLEAQGDLLTALVQGVMDEAGSPKENQEALMYADLALWIPEESNMRTDKMTMAHALESRAPFQDHTLVEEVMKISLRDKVGLPLFSPKKLLKDSFKDLLPDHVARRPKWGWFSPVHYWVNDYLWGDLVELIDYLPETGIFRPNVRNLVREHPTATPAKVWSLGVFALWHQAYTGGNS